MAQIALDYSAAQINAAIGTSNTLDQKFSQLEQKCKHLGDITNKENTIDFKFEKNTIPGMHIWEFATSNSDLSKVGLVDSAKYNFAYGEGSILISFVHIPLRYHDYQILITANCILTRQHAADTWLPWKPDSKSAFNPNIFENTISNTSDFDNIKAGVYQVFGFNKDNPVDFPSYIDFESNIGLLFCWSQFEQDSTSLKSQLIIDAKGNIGRRTHSSKVGPPYSWNSWTWTPYFNESLEEKKYGVKGIQDLGAMPSGHSVWGIKNTRCQKEGLLTQISINVARAGSLTFVVGLLDQRNNLVNINGRSFEKIFSEDETEQIVTFDVSDKNILVKENEQLFVIYNEDDPESAGPCYRAGLSFEDRTHETIAGRYPGINIIPFGENPEAASAFPYGVFITLKYTVSSYTGRFAEKKDIKDFELRINEVESLVNSSGVIYDSLGKPYKLIVVNGEVKPKSLLYKKVVALGNSLTNHPYAANVNWLTQGYAMAATKEELSWTYQLQNILQNYDSLAQVIPFNIHKWEKNPLIDPSTIIGEDGETYLDDILTQDVDLVIFRAGENNITAQIPVTQETYETGLTKLINHIKTQCPLADILITSLMWSETMRDSAFLAVSEKLHLPYMISVGGNMREKLGDFCLSSDKELYFPITHTGVAYHVDDCGFFLFANAIANKLGLSPLENIYDIVINSSVDYSLNRNIGVGGSIKTILTYGQNSPNIVIKDSENHSIPVTHRDMSSVTWIDRPDQIPTWGSTFIMPESNITIQIS